MTWSQNKYGHIRRPGQACFLWFEGIGDCSENTTDYKWYSYFSLVPLLGTILRGKFPLHVILSHSVLAVIPAWWLFKGSVTIHPFTILSTCLVCFHFSYWHPVLELTPPPRPNNMTKPVWAFSLFFHAPEEKVTTTLIADWDVFHLREGESWPLFTSRLSSCWIAFWSIFSSYGGRKGNDNCGKMVAFLSEEQCLHNQRGRGREEKLRLNISGHIMSREL